jgi:hypothetical protein
MKLSLIHLNSKPFEFEHNIAQIENSYKMALGDSPDAVLFPELAISGFFMITDKKMLTHKNIMYNELCLNKLHELVKLHNIPILIGAVIDMKSVYAIINQTGISIAHTRNAHLGTSNVGSIVLNGNKMSIIICDESMHTKMVDSSLNTNPDIILHPSAFGEPLPCVDYPLRCSPYNTEKLNNALFITINISDTDMHGNRSYGRTSILKGNAVLFSTSSNKTQIVLYDTLLDVVQTRQLINAN